MHTTAVLHKLLKHSAPSIHAVRLTALTDAVWAVAQGAQVSITSLGRHLQGNAFDKHKIKRMDRLVGNPHVFRERLLIYKAVTTTLLNGLAEPVIVVDWSPLCADQRWHLLRAAVPVGGRSLTLYEEVHPRSELGNRRVQHQFLSTLARLVPSGSTPIIVADSGFKTPFFRYVEQTLGWHWVGRIRGQDVLRYSAQCPWFSAKSLYSRARKTPRIVGAVDWTRMNAFSAWIVLAGRIKKQRTSNRLDGTRRTSKLSKTHANREREPWLLVASHSLGGRTAKQIQSIYRTRMQIEEGFRDSKSVHYGVGLSQHARMHKHRRTVLCLMATLATFVLWCIGVAGKTSPLVRRVKVNSSSQRDPYSVIFLAKLLIAQPSFSVSESAFKSSLRQIKIYSQDVLSSWG